MRNPPADVSALNSEADQLKLRKVQSQARQWSHDSEALQDELRDFLTERAWSPTIANFGHDAIAV